ncbi:MAG: fibronectin type III domain-containing protein, partial [Calditrichia bacterium]|nr:fibronectin type III domain-containing protein [Calditrichia bacterium]
RIMQTTAVEKGAAGKDNRYGAGRVDAYEAYLQAVSELSDPGDPNPPVNVTAYSDYTTPTSMLLSWDDPTTLFNGNPLLPTEFTIQIQRNGAPLAVVPGGTEQYTDTGLNDGQLYDYILFAKLIANDSTSLPIEASWIAGGSPVPAAPANLACSATSTQAILTWDDPTTQEDGTPLDDLDHINIYRDGNQVATVAPGVQTYTDTPPPGFTYAYSVRAVDDETPPNLSTPSNTVECFVGDTPSVLVWVGPDAVAASAASGDSILAALAANGRSSFLTDDLFEFGNDLSIYDAIFVVLGIFPNNHSITSGSPEGQALQSYLQNGGSIYLEGGDCFN